jgi:hypothetical protein
LPRGFAARNDEGSGFVTVDSSDAPTLLTPRILIPFLVCTLIWG